MTTETSLPYAPFLSSRCQKQWERIGIQRRAGVAVPLFSLYSKGSVGIGEIPDLGLLMDWCQQTGMSLIQLLPLNDVGFDFRPYDAQSSIALEPMYLSIEQLCGVDLKPHRREIEALRKKFPVGRGRVNTQIKAAKLELLRQIYNSQARNKKNPEFESYATKNRSWLDDYALFKAIKDTHQQKSWEEWPAEFKQRNPQALENFRRNHSEEIQFYEWLQWELYNQMAAVKKAASQKGIFLVGDIPFLVSRDSVDVWAHQDHFKLEFSAGAPPDLYFAQGQRWGMPTYNWGKIAHHHFNTLREKLTYAEKFFDCYRIDHLVGIFRLWTIPLSEPLESGGLHGFFDPREESLWEEHGRRILDVMVAATAMLPCAEDLGTIPACSWPVLEEYGIPGIDVQRWSRDWNRTYDFKAPEAFRKNSIANISTHDMSILRAWWEVEAGTVDEQLFRRLLASRSLSFETVRPQLFDAARSRHGRLRWKPEIDNAGKFLSIVGLREDQARDLLDLYHASFRERQQFWKYLGIDGEPREESTLLFLRRALEKVSAASSIFSIQLLQDWLSLSDLLPGDSWQQRINFPGLVIPHNWTWVAPLPLEELVSQPVNSLLKALNTQASRI